MKNKKYPIICFEGVDGSGKTTLSKLLTKKLKGRYIKSPPDSIAKTRKLIGDANDDITFHHYVFGDSAAGLLAQGISKYKTVCPDRYHYSTRVYHHNVLSRGAKIPILPKENLIVYLSAEWSVIDKRLDERGDRKKHENLINLKKIHNRYKKLFKNNKDVMYIDTSKNNIKESLELILRRINYEK